MNRLIVSLQHSILTLASRGWSARRIARELAINRETVGRYLRSKPAIVTTGFLEGEADSKPAISTLGSEGVEAEAKPAISTTAFSPGRKSDSSSFAAEIETGLTSGLSLKRIHQDLVSDHAFTGS